MGWRRAIAPALRIAARPRLRLHLLPIGPGLGLGEDAIHVRIGLREPAEGAAQLLVGLGSPLGGLERQSHQEQRQRDRERSPGAKLRSDMRGFRSEVRTGRCFERLCN